MDYFGAFCKLLCVWSLCVPLLLALPAYRGPHHSRGGPRRLSRSGPLFGDLADSELPLGENDLHVYVRPKYVTMGPNDIVAVRCRAKGGRTLDDVPDIMFYRKFGDETHMPLSSGDPGVLVRTQPSYGGPGLYNKTFKTLYLGKDAWLTMNFGHNVFYCRGSNDRGNSRVSYFVIHKVWGTTKRRSHSDTFSAVDYYR